MLVEDLAKDIGRWLLPKGYAFKGVKESEALKAELALAGYSGWVVRQY